MECPATRPLSQPESHKQGSACAGSASISKDRQDAKRKADTIVDLSATKKALMWQLFCMQHPNAAQMLAGGLQRPGMAGSDVVSTGGSRCGSRIPPAGPDGGLPPMGAAAQSMIDALRPAALAAWKPGMTLQEVAAAKLEGADSTKPMTASTGRANWVGKDSYDGVPDPGAAAVALVLEAAAKD